MPEDLLNVVSLRLVSWTFPENFYTFSVINGNVEMTFQITNPYNPMENGVTDVLLVKIYEYFTQFPSVSYSVVIEDGFYTHLQMTTELTNKCNNALTNQILSYFIEQSTNPLLSPVQQAEYLDAISLLNAAGGYNNFVIVYNEVSQKFWFGNVCDGFLLTNETQLSKQTNVANFICTAPNSNVSPDFSNWGLPGNLGLSRCNTESVNGITLQTFTEKAIYSNGAIVPRFYYGDVKPGDNGFWLVPKTTLPGSSVNWVQAEYKNNLLGPEYIYMELAGQNCIDETRPYNISNFTIKTNSTNGIVNSSFSKIGMYNQDSSHWFDRDAIPYKFYYPPAERMRRFYFKLRYHNGQLVNFGVCNFSFMIEFTLQLPQILRNAKAQSAQSLY
jgi:hypothetical protein